MIAWILIFLIKTPLKVITLHVMLIMSSKIILDLRLKSTIETCHMLNKQCGMQDSLTKS